MAKQSVSSQLSVQYQILCAMAEDKGKFYLSEAQQYRRKGDLLNAHSAIQEGLRVTEGHCLAVHDELATLQAALRADMAQATRKENEQLAQEFAPLRRRGFGTVRNCFKLYDRQGNEFSLSQSGEVCLFKTESVHTVDSRAYPADAEVLVSLMADFLGYKMVRK